MGFDLGSVAGSAISAGASLLGGAMSAAASKKIAKMQIKAQREFAQNGIQWRVSDAKQAGLHPLYALGANTASYTPVSQDSSAMGNAVADAGAYLGKAVDQALSKADQAALQQENLEYARMMREGNLELMRQNIRGKKLDNDFNEQQMVNSLRAQGSANPARPLVVSTPMGEFNVNNPDKKRYTAKVAGNGATALSGVSLEPAKVVMSSPGNPAQTAGANSDYSLVRTENGYTKVPSEQFANSTDDDIVNKVAWNLRNSIGDRIGNLPRDLDVRYYPLPKNVPLGFDTWRFHRIRGEWLPYDRGRDEYYLVGPHKRIKYAIW
jgi:hypothetical protein